MPTLLSSKPQTAMQTHTYSGTSIAECLVKARQELGPEAMILGKRTFRKGAFLGRWGGTLMYEVTFGLDAPVLPAVARPHIVSESESRRRPGGVFAAREEPAADGPDLAKIQRLESEIAELTASVQGLVDAGKKGGFTAVPVQAQPVAEPAPAPKRGRPAKRSATEEPVVPDTQSVSADPYPTLYRQLLDSDVAPPLARQLVGDLPAGLSTGEAASQLRTVLSQRLLLASRIEVPPGAKMRLLAFVGTTGVGKTTTIAKLAARYALVERRRIGIVTLDTHRVAAAQQLQTYGDILRVPVKVAHDKHELTLHLEHFTAEKMELVLIDTAGRSPHDMIPLGETAHLFDGAGDLQKILAIPATLGARDMENVVARFQNILAPDALILTKLDEASDNTCFGKLLTVQAKYGVPLAYVTTGQKVPDDIAFPDAHAIAARILSTAVL